MNNDFDIAIIGMSCRLPGSENVDEFWQNLLAGSESITRLCDAEILQAGVPASYLADRTYVKAAPVLNRPGHFDAAFFGFSPMEAKIMDPQHRILLELAHEALENGAYDPDRFQGRVGVFAGSALNTYYTNVGLDSRLAEQYIPTLIGNDKDFLSTRISYKLNLRGPSITVQTACSTSMVAVHLARQSLLSGETDMALAGAISVRVPHRAGYLFDAGGVVSPDGHVRAFDAKANGTVFGSGGGMLVLRRLTDALNDGDTIRAVIKGSAVNNDGSQKAGYTAPSVDSQADAVVEALANAGLDADSISYVEAHGSGTPIGDPIEIAALTKAFRSFTTRSGYCAIGAVKTNIGHLDAAAAVAGIIKTVLALEHRQLPPTLNFTAPNPEIDFSRTPFFVNTRLREWTAAGPRRAGVMSTGMGGTNAHVVLEEAPESQASASPSPPYLLVLSAKTESALERATQRLLEFLKDATSAPMSDVAYTLQMGRKAFRHRRVLLCDSRQDAVRELGNKTSKRRISGQMDDSRRPVVFLVPGVGDHYVGMGHELYRTSAIFKEAVDRCAQILEPLLQIDIRTIIYPSGQDWKKDGRSKGIDLRAMLGAQTDALEDEDSKKLNRTLFVQPALFTIEYAMARLWQSLGITPDAILGHSLGEYVAACLAGVFTLDDALRLVVARAKLVDRLPRGGMLAVTLPESALRSLLDQELSISLINGPEVCVVAGPVTAIAEFEKRLNERNIVCRRVQNAHAFHSKMLAPIAAAFEAEVSAVRLNAPSIPYVSNVTGTWITAAEATDPSYWAMHATRTARFSDALHELWQLENPILVENGPGRTLSVLALQHPDRPQGAPRLAVSSIRPRYENQSDTEFLLRAVANLWASGATIDWDGLHAGSRRRRVPLPTYPFERQFYWLDGASGKEKDERDERTGKGDVAGVDDWFYFPTWERTAFPLGSSIDPPLDAGLWLIFADQYGGGVRIKSWLDDRGQRAVFVRFGRSFTSRSNDGFELDPDGLDDYLKLFRNLNAREATTINVVHLGSVTRDDEEVSTSFCAGAQKFGFYSLMRIAQAIGELNIAARVKLGILSNRLHDVTGGERLHPAMATVLGPCGVIPQEYPNVDCFSIDLPDDQAIDGLGDQTIATVLSEYAQSSRGRILAYRGRHRWERRYEKVRLPKWSVQADGAFDEVRQLRQGGIYLITGGTGGIGLSIAKYLAEAYGATVLLTKKTSFPERSQWTNLASGTSDLARTATALLEIERLGGKVEIFVADVSDRKQMQAAVGEMRTRFKTIHGVIHAAGIVRAGLMQAKTREVVESVMSPKVYGAVVLFELFKDEALDFLVLFSSITSVITPYAECDYSGANAFLDAFGNFANANTRFRTLTINWPGWKEVGQLANLEVRPGLEAWKEAALAKAIRTVDGLEAFKRALNSDLEQVVVSPEDLGHLLKESQAPFDHRKYLAQVQKDADVAAPQGDREQRMPRPTDEVENVLASMWSGVLGSEEIGLHDNFSQIGGHSLLAMQIVAKIRSSYQIDFSLREFFEAPTIAELGSAVRAKIGQGAEAQMRDKPLIALSPMGQRSFSSTSVQKAHFFGHGNRRIFAIHHPPVAAAASERGGVLTVICAPLFNEYMRTQLALRELAIGLAEKGHYVLRFDYRGTGDSSGELEQVVLSDWLEDIALVIDEGRAVSGSREVRLAGVRAGGLLACRAAAVIDDVERVVLWDPVTGGRQYLQAMRRIQQAMMTMDGCVDIAATGDPSDELGGYRLSRRLVEQLSALDADTYANAAKGNVYIVSTSSDNAAELPNLHREVTPFACNWETEFENLMMPKPVLERLGECLTMS